MKVFCFPFKTDLFGELLTKFSTSTCFVFPDEELARQFRIHSQSESQGKPLQIETRDTFFRQIYRPDYPVMPRDHWKWLAIAQMRPEDQTIFHVRHALEASGLVAQLRGLIEECRQAFPTEPFAETMARLILVCQENPDQVALLYRLSKWAERIAQAITDRQLSSGFEPYSRENIRSGMLAELEHICFVQIVSLTSFEQRVCDTLEHDRPGLFSFVFHGPDSWLDQETLNLSEIDLAQLKQGDFRLQKMKVILCPDEIQEMTALSAILSESEGKQSVLMAKNNSQRWKYLLSPEVVSIPFKVPYRQTQLYFFLDGWDRILSSRWNSKLHLDTLIDLAQSKVFTRKYPALIEALSDLQTKRQRGVIWISAKVAGKTFQNDLLFLMEGDIKTFFPWLEDRLDASFEERYLDQAIWGIHSLCLQLTVAAENSLISGKMVREFQQMTRRNFSLAWLLAQMNEFELKINPLEVEGSPHPVFNESEMGSRRFYSFIMVDANNGVLPKRTSYPPFVSFAQRASIGLSAFDQKERRAAYRFFQRLFFAEEATFIAVQNLDQNAELSPWVELVSWTFPALCERVQWNFGDSYRLIAEKLLAAPREFRAVSGPLALKQTEADLSDQALTISYSSYSRLVDCGLRFFLQDRLRLRANPVDKGPNVGSDILGSLVHDIFAAAAQQMKTCLRGQVDVQTQLKTLGLSKLILKIKRGYEDRLPVAYQDPYFTEIVAPQVERSLQHFFIREIPAIVPWPHLQAMMIEGEGEVEPLLLLEHLQGAKGPSIWLKARADLRIETLDNEVILIDFKTGTTQDTRQLDLYYDFYYGNPARAQQKRIKALGFYAVFDEKFSSYQEPELTSEDVVMAIKAFAQAPQYGLARSVKSCRYCDFKKVCHRE